MDASLPIAQAKARFAECVRRAEAGERVILTRHGRPVAQLSPVAPTTGDAIDLPDDELREPDAGYHSEARSRSALVTPESRREALRLLLERVVWPRIPEHQLGVGIDKGEREEILGYRSDGV